MPFDWDEADIDSREGAPLRESESVPALSFAERYQEMRDIGLSDREVIERLGITASSVERQLDRYGIPVSPTMRELARVERRAKRQTA